jgi:hypothetical protein
MHSCTLNNTVVQSPFAGNNHEIKNETIAVARQRTSPNNGSTVGSGVFYKVRSEVM